MYVKKLQQDTANDSMIRHQMANLFFRLACTIGNFLALVLVAAHTANNLDLSHEQSFENQVWKSG